MMMMMMMVLLELEKRFLDCYSSGMGKPRGIYRTFMLYWNGEASCVLGCNFVMHCVEECMDEDGERNFRRYISNQFSCRMMMSGLGIRKDTCGCN